MARSIAPPLNSLAFGLILCIWLTGCATSSAPTVDQSRALSFDGLTPLENTKMTQVWVREGFSLGGYRKVMFSGAGIQYRPVASRPGVGPRTSADEFPLSEAQKKELENLITEEFDKALTRLTLEEVNAPGPDVLLVTGDHSTPSAMAMHSWHPVPVAFAAKNCRQDDVSQFGESHCLRGGLGTFEAKYLLTIALAHTGRLQKFGA